MITITNLYVTINVQVEDLKKVPQKLADSIPAGSAQALSPAKIATMPKMAQEASLQMPKKPRAKGAIIENSPKIAGIKHRLPACAKCGISKPGKHFNRHGEKFEICNKCVGFSLSPKKPNFVLEEKSNLGKSQRRPRK